MLYSGNLSHVQRHIEVQNKGMEEYLPSKWKTTKAEVAILVSNKTDFKKVCLKNFKKTKSIT